MCPFSIHVLPRVESRLRRLPHFADMGFKWKEKRMLQMRFILILGKTKLNKNSWLSFSEVGENHGQQKTEDLPIMVKVGTIGRYGESLPPPREGCPPSREQHIQWMQITKVMEALGNYLFKNQLPEEQPYFQENSRTSFVLEGVPDVGQDFHLVPEIPLLLRGSDVTLELWPNRLIHRQLCRWHRMNMRKAICRHWKYKRKKMSRSRSRSKEHSDAEST
jgi:hypothetical protein